MFVEKRFRIIQISLLVIGLLLSLFYAQHQILTGDQLQMFKLGYMGAIQNNWTSYGNAASAVGNVPGSLMAYSVGIPLKIYNSPWSPMFLLIFLHFLSYLLLDNVLKDIFNTNTRLLFIILYWLNPWFLFENILYNPSYLFFFSALHLWSAYKQREKSSLFYSTLHVLSIGMALQFHYSWIILPMISLYLIYKNIVQVNWFGVLLGIIIVVGSLVPYFMEFINNESIRHNADPHTAKRYIGWGGLHIYPVLKAISYWFRYDSLLFPNKLINSTTFSWLATGDLKTIIIYFYKTFVFGIAIGSLYISYLANKFLYKKVSKSIFIRNKKVNKREWIEFYIVGAFLAVILSAILSPIIFSYWHVIIVFPFAILVLVLYFSENDVYARKIMPFIFGYFIFINLIGAVDSEKYTFKSDLSFDIYKYSKLLNLE